MTIALAVGAAIAVICAIVIVTLIRRRGRR